MCSGPVHQRRTVTVVVDIVVIVVVGDVIVAFDVQLDKLCAELNHVRTRENIHPLRNDSFSFEQHIHADNFQFVFQLAKPYRCVSLPFYCRGTIQHPEKAENDS